MGMPVQLLAPRPAHRSLAFEDQPEAVLDRELAAPLGDQEINLSMQQQRQVKLRAHLLQTDTLLAERESQNRDLEALYRSKKDEGGAQAQQIIGYRRLIAANTEQIALLHQERERLVNKIQELEETVRTLQSALVAKNQQYAALELTQEQRIQTVQRAARDQIQTTAANMSTYQQALTELYWVKK